MKYDVSLIIIAYNEEKYLPILLDSIMSQKTNLKMEIILVDDSSTDNTVNIAKSYNTVKVIHNDRKADLINNNLNTKKVLIVDDSKLNIKVAKKVLSNFNLQVDECDNGFDCLERVNNGINYDLILMDIMMPEMSGETTLAKLKSNPQFNIPVIALTADAVAGAREKYISEGFTDYLVKPFTKEQMKEKIDLILNQDSK